MQVIDDSTYANTCKIIAYGSAGATTLTLTDSRATADYPAVGNVRYGTVYASSGYTGTARIPTAAQTSSGVLVDATVGTAVLTQQNLLDSPMSGATTAGSLGKLIADNLDAPVSEAGGGGGGGGGGGAYDDLFVKGTNSHDDKQILEIALLDSTTAAGKTALTSADLTAYWIRQGDATATIFTLAVGTAGTYVNSGAAGTGGGFIKIDDTNLPGVYQLSLSDAMLASSTTANSVTIELRATGMVPKYIRLLLVDVDVRDSVRMGMTALPNAAANAAGGLPVSTAGALAMDTIGSDVVALYNLRPAYTPTINSTGKASVLTSDIVTDLQAVGTYLYALYGLRPSYAPEINSSGRVSVGTNYDKAAYSISGTKQTLDSLNDATQLVQRGEPPLASAIVTAMQDTGTQLKAVYDLRPAYTPSINSTGKAAIQTTDIVTDVQAVGTYLYGLYALRPAYAPEINSSGRASVGTNYDKGGYSISGTKQTLDALHDATQLTQRSEPPTPTEVWAAGTRTLSAFAFAPVPSNAADTTAIKGVTDQMRFTTANKIDATTASGGDATAAGQTVIINHLLGIKGTTWSASTDSLEAIRDRGDAAWTSGGVTEGKVAVDHNTGGTDNLRYTTVGGAAISGAAIRAYVAADYAAGTYTLRARTTTTDTGRWSTPMYLDGGVPYTLVFEKPGVYGPNTKAVTP
jgi:hypothetical protein